MTTQEERIATLEADARIKAANLELALARVAELEADAARYRWLRHGDNDERVLMRGPIHKDYVYLLRAEKLDAAIDAAMKDTP